jgi:hypothetical protein
MKFLTRILPFAALAPSFAFAAAADFTYFTSIIAKVSDIINTLIPIVLALALLLFLWGMFQYFILGGGDEGKRETGRSYMIYGLIGLAVMVAVWGLVNLLISIVGVSAGTSVTVPVIPR